MTRSHIARLVQHDYASVSSVSSQCKHNIMPVTVSKNLRKETPWTQHFANDIKYSFSTSKRHSTCWAPPSMHCKWRWEQVGSSHSHMQKFPLPEQWHTKTGNSSTKHGIFTLSNYKIIKATWNKRQKWRHYCLHHCLHQCEAGSELPLFIWRYLHFISNATVIQKKYKVSK